MHLKNPPLQELIFNMRNHNEYHSIEEVGYLICLGFRVRGFGFRGWGLRFGVWGSGFRVS